MQYKKLYGWTDANSSTSDREVIRRLYRMMLPEVKRDRALRKRRHDVYRGVLEEHHRWQSLIELAGKNY